MSSIDNMSEIQAKQALQKEEMVCKSVKSKLWSTGKELQRTQTTLDLSLNMLFTRVTDQDEAMELANQLELYIEADTGNRGWIDTYTSKSGRQSYAHYMGIPTEPKYCGKAKLGDAVNIYTDHIRVGTINDYISAWEYDPTPKLWSQKFKPVLTPNARFLTKLTLYISYKSRGEPSPAYWNGAVEQFNQWKRDQSKPKKKVLPKKLKKDERLDDTDKQASDY